MYKRNGSFFKSLFVAACLLAIFLPTVRSDRGFAQATGPLDTTAVLPIETLNPDEQNTVTDPVTTLAQTYDASSDAGDQEPPVPAKQPRLNRVVGEAFSVLDQKAGARPLLFLNVLIGMLGALLLLARLRTRQIHRSLRYIAHVRHRSHI